MDAPQTEAHLYAWISGPTVSYLLVAYLVHGIRCLRGTRLAPTSKFFIQKLFDGVTFSGSIMLFWGIFANEILKLLGNTTIFLIIAAIAGIGYAIHSLFD